MIAIIRRPLFAWCVVAFYGTVSFVLSAQTHLTPPLASVVNIDKLYHGVFYAGLGMVLSHALHMTWPKIDLWRMCLLAILSGVLWGASDEWHQAFVPGRQPDAMDLLADAIGVSVGATGYRLIVSWVGRWVQPRLADCE